jgi:putative aldouronate transport system substrate-binding protein
MKKYRLILLLVIALSLLPLESGYVSSPEMDSDGFVPAALASFQITSAPLPTSAPTPEPTPAASPASEATNALLAAQSTKVQPPSQSLKTSYVSESIVTSPASQSINEHHTALINKKWCDNLGLSLPTTWDELYNVLVAFRDRDPNQNGQNDEIPMDSWYFSSFGFFNLLGSTGIQCVDLNNENYYFAEDGKVKCIFNDVRLKRFLSFLNKLYAEKLINQEVFTRDYSTMITMAQGDPETKTAKVGLNFSWSAESLYGPALADQYVALPPIKESAGSTIEPRYTFDDLRYGANMIVMSANTKDKAAAMRLINAFYSPEYSIQSRFGGIGEGIEQTSNGYKLLPSADPSIDRDTYTWLITINSYGPYYISESLNSRFEREITGAFAEKVAYNEAHARIDWKKDYLGIKFFKISPEDYETMGLNSANFNVISYWAKWVTEGGIENEWDAYIDHLTKNGLEENLKILQKYQDAYIANMK